MQIFKYGTGIKVLAFILFLLMITVAFASILSAAYMASDGYYANDASFYNTDLCRTVTRNYARTVFYDYFYLLNQQNLDADGQYQLSQYKKEFAPGATNFIFTIKNEEGTSLLSNSSNLPVKIGARSTFTYHDDVLTDDGTAGVYTLSCSVTNPLSAGDDYARAFQVYQSLYPARFAVVFSAAVASLLAFLLFLFLMCAAGRKKDSAEIHMAWHHKVPLDLYAAGLILLAWVSIMIVSHLEWSWERDYRFLLMFLLALLVNIDAAASLGFLMNLAVRVKKGRWWENTVVCRLLRLLAKGVSLAFKWLGRFLSKLPMIWQAALLTAGYLFFNMVLCVAILGAGSYIAVLLWLVFNVSVFIFLCRIMLQLKELKAAGEKIAAGDYGCKVDAQRMLWDMRQHAISLNSIISGMSAAVEDRLKSERLKTELITNVSHDLKTPLTSIVNYIDLLKKETMDNPAAVGYIEVLDRQSMKLKKLTDDLLEASKASTGNVQVMLARTDLVELINQAMGEYSSHLEEARLDTIFHTDKKEALISADGRLLWRVLDNLLSNICRYSQPSTRVYITVESDGNETKVTLMNISKYPLNISADELQERFVRGDSSRTTEGSGLGLSIVRSLTELQKGRFDLSIDGDLFKAMLVFQSIS